MTKNYFLKELDFYVREINPIRQYVDQTSFYLSRMSGKTSAVCREHVIKNMKDPEGQARDPMVTFFQRDDTLDKFVTSDRLSNYINEVVTNGEILAPTLTTYVPVTERKSILVDFIDANTARRTMAKKAAFKAEAQGKQDLFIAKNNEQSNMKVYNSSLSGAFASKGSSLSNPSAHSTLTSTTRSVSSIGNASNEKIIAGNRHYFNPDVTLANLISICTDINTNELEKIIVKYKLVYPTFEDVIECVKYSSDLYWKPEVLFNDIRAFIMRMTPIERAAVMYVGDLYHIRKLNDGFLRRFLGQLSLKVKDTPVPDPVTLLNNADEQIVNFAHIICMEELKGKGKDYASLDKEIVNLVAATVININATIFEYRDFIETIFLSKNIPASTAHISSMVRRTVVLSDTDSTMFSVDEYVTWYFGKLLFTSESYALAGSVMFLATQCMTHILAILSANINVSREKLQKLAMKPEFGFSVFCAASVAKHYFTSINIKEGNVFKEPLLEIKGVHLKNSAAPKSLIKNAHERMVMILEAVKRNEKLSLIDEIKHVAGLEDMITKSLMSGQVEYFKHSKIKNHEGYSKPPEQSPYTHHTLWLDVFSSKYGQIDAPPYTVIKVPTTVLNPSGIVRWLESIEDKDISDKLDIWLKQHNKRALPTMYLSDEYVRAFGIPEEIKKVINVKKILLDLTGINRMILETLGYFPKEGLTLTEAGYTNE